MSIHDFHSKLVSNHDENALVSMLRKLSLLDDPRRFQEDEDPLSDWTIWAEDFSPVAAR